MNENRNQYALKLLLSAMHLKKSTYFDYIRRLPSQRHEKMLQRRQYILEIFKESNSVYGARKIQQKLIERDIHVSVKTIQNDMRTLHLVSRYCKKFKPGKSSKRQQTHTSNILKDTNVIKKHTAVVTDITYVWTSCHAWVYVLTYIDVFTRKVLHYDIGRRMTSEFVNVNTKHVLQKYPSVALIHSDQGSQYTALSYRELLLAFNVVASYSKPGYPYDNAIIESYHASLKRESLYWQSFQTIDDVEMAVFRYNYGFYNTQRIHQALNYLTPNQFEQMCS